MIPNPSDSRGESPALLVAVLTAPGRGAVAAVALAGRDAVSALAAHFTPAAPRPLPQLPLGRIAFGRWRSQPHDAGEEVVVSRLDESQWELHCHGGAAAVESIMTALERRGATRVSADAWIDQLDDDPLRAAAIQQLVHARTPLAAALLASQAQGALRGRLEAILAMLRAGDAPRVLEQLERLAETSAVGLHLTKPWRVAIVGRPNAGKSSLINRLAGYERAIVADQPGTTRDVVTALVAAHGWLFELADTAGMRATTDAIEAAGVARAEEQRAAADLVLLVADLASAWSHDDERLARGSSVALVVHNKIDLVHSADDVVSAGDRPPGLLASAQTGAGCDAIWDAIVRRLIPSPPAPREPLIFTREQSELMESILDAVRRGDLATAEFLLQSAISRRAVRQTAPSASGNTTA